MSSTTERDCAAGGGRDPQLHHVRFCGKQSRVAVLDDLRGLAPDVFASQHIFEAVPFIFGGDVPSYVLWKTELGARLEIDPRAIAIVGSASLGFSLNPDKNLKTFDKKSDVDVAVVSYRHFEAAWEHLRGLSIPLLSSVEAQNAVKAHQSGYIFNCTIATDFILEFLPFAPQWLKAFTHMAGVPPTEGREIKARIYRDFDSLRQYQLGGVLAARTHLEGT